MHAPTQPLSDYYILQSDCSWVEQGVDYPPTTPVDMPEQSPGSVLTDVCYSPTLPDTESYPDLLEYDFPCSYPMADEHTGLGSPHTSTPGFTPPCVESTTSDLSAEIAESSSSDLEQVYTHPTYLSALGELQTSGDGAYYPCLPIESHTFPTLWDSQYAEGFSPLTTVPALDTQLEDSCATNSIYISSPSDTSFDYPPFLSPVDYSTNEPMLDGWADWNLDPAYSEVAGMNQVLQNNMTLEDWQPTFLSYPTTFYMKGGASLTIETTLRVSPAACRCGGNYLPAMNVNELDHQQKSLEYC
ncbi:hypothetical protein EYR36_012055 [Pleurotus pulmonarius]|nr:hypothetical protein EYR36_012055 [Pleurotus pulmonarius]